MPAIALDITRLVSRLDGKAMTGIDRVELAYLAHFAARSGEFVAFCLVGRQVLVFPKANCAGIIDMLKTVPPNAGKLARLAMMWRLFRLSERRVLATKFSDWLDTSFAAGLCVLNVGHSFKTLEYCQVRTRGAALAVLIHDTIPIDFPHYQRDGATARFRAGMASVAKHANIIITNSHDTAASARAVLGADGFDGPIHAIPLGIDPASVVPRKPQSEHPYFVQLGTIEPRKNTRLLLDVWAALWRVHDDASPHLHIIGRRGWKNADVFHDLDTAEFMNRTVFEHRAASDTEAMEMLSGASALLFPSFAEGFGLPLFEARQLGVPIIASDIPVFREFAHKDTKLMPDLSVATWMSEIMRTSNAPNIKRFPAPVPQWSGHFDALGALLDELR